MRIRSVPVLPAAGIVLILAAPDIACAEEKGTPRTPEAQGAAGTTGTDALLDAWGLPKILEQGFLETIRKQVASSVRLRPEQREPMIRRLEALAGPKIRSLLAGPFERLEESSVPASLAFLRSDAGRAITNTFQMALASAQGKGDGWVQALEDGERPPPPARTGANARNARAVLLASGFVDGVVDGILGLEARNLASPLKEIVADQLTPSLIDVEERHLLEALTFFDSAEGKNLAGALRRAYGLVVADSEKWLEGLAQEANPASPGIEEKRKRHELEVGRVEARDRLRAIVAAEASYAEQKGGLYATLQQLKGEGLIAFDPEDVVGGYRFSIAVAADRRSFRAVATPQDEAGAKAPHFYAGDDGAIQESNGLPPPD